MTTKVKPKPKGIHRTLLGISFGFETDLPIADVERLIFHLDSASWSMRPVYFDAQHASDTCTFYSLSSGIWNLKRLIRVKGMLLTTDNGSTLVSGKTHYNILQITQLCLLTASQLLLSFWVALTFKDQLCILYPAAVIILSVWTIWQIWRLQKRMVRSIYDALHR